MTLFSAVGAIAVGCIVGSLVSTLLRLDSSKILSFSLLSAIGCGAVAWMFPAVLGVWQQRLTMINGFESLVWIAMPILAIVALVLFLAIHLLRFIPGDD